MDLNSDVEAVLSRNDRLFHSYWVSHCESPITPVLKGLLQPM